VHASHTPGPRRHARRHALTHLSLHAHALTRTNARLARTQTDARTNTQKHNALTHARTNVQAPAHVTANVFLTHMHAHALRRKHTNPRKDLLPTLSQAETNNATCMRRTHPARVAMLHRPHMHSPTLKTKPCCRACKESVRTEMS
jgi:hypothetical protein